MMKGEGSEEEGCPTCFEVTWNYQPRKPVSRGSQPQPPQVLSWQREKPLCGDPTAVPRSSSIGIQRLKECGWSV